MVGGLCWRTGKRTQSETSVEIHAHYVLCGTAWEQLRFEEDAAGLKGNVFGTWYFGQGLFFSPPLAMLEHATRGNNITVLLRFWAAHTDRILEGGFDGWVHRTTTHHHHQLSGQLKKMAFSRCHIISHSWVRMKTFAQWINHKTPDLQETVCLALCKTPGLMLCCSFPAFGNRQNQGSHKHKAKPWLEVLSLALSITSNFTHTSWRAACLK